MTYLARTFQRPRRPRWSPTILAAALALLTTAACSDPPIDCNPPIQPGARYRVTLGPETPRSTACHIVRADSMPSTFEISAAEPDPAVGHQACYTTPAAQPPPQRSISLLSCRGAEAQQLGMRCEMQYPSTCEGQIWFYFDTPAGAPPVNWRAPVIDAVFKIQDAATGCLPNVANCVDEYAARLERLQ